MKDYFFSTEQGFLYEDEFNYETKKRMNLYLDYDLYFKEGFLYLLKVDMTFQKLGIYSYLYKDEICLPLRKSKYNIKQLYYLQKEGQFGIDHIFGKSMYMLDSDPDNVTENKELEIKTEIPF